MEYDVGPSSTGESSSGSEDEHPTGIGNIVGEEIPHTGHNNALLTAGIIIADVVGAGILGMPVAVAKFGWALGSILLVVLLAANVHISILMWKVRVQCPACCKAITYSDLVHGAFAQAPDWQRQAVFLVAGFAQKTFLFGLMGLYLMSAGKGFGMVFYTQQTCLPSWAALAAGLLFPFAAFSRNMGSCQMLVWLNIITLIGTVVIPLVYYGVHGTEDVIVEGSVVKAVAHLSTTGVLSGLSTYTFGMTSQFMLMEIISEMKDPMELPKAYAGISAPFQLGMFMLAGIGGYLYMGNKVTGMMNENLPFGVSFQIASICMFTHMLISYLIKGVVFCKSIHKAVDVSYSKSSDQRIRSWLGWVTTVAGTLVVAWVLANVVPFFGDAVDLLGASLTPLSCWVIPIVMFVRHWYDSGDNKPHVSALEWLVIALEVVLSLVLMVFGTISVLQTIKKDWDSFGNPFECHCEGLWNTCECSSDHPGMSQVCEGILSNLSIEYP